MVMKEIGELIAKGNTAEVFEYENGKVCKLFNTGYPKEYVELEYSNAKVLCEKGLPVPKVYELVEKDGRFGIIYERIQGDAFFQLFLTKPEEAFAKFIQTQKDFFDKISEELISYKDIMLESMRRADYENPELFEKIQALPDGEVICHGDYHPYNIMLKADETVVVIDFMNVCRGKWEYDVARTYVILTEVKEEVAKAYLSAFGVEYAQIEEYADVVQEYRKFELR